MEEKGLPRNPASQLQGYGYSLGVGPSCVDLKWQIELWYVGQSFGCGRESILPSGSGGEPAIIIASI